MNMFQTWTASSMELPSDPKDFSALAGRWNEVLDVQLSNPYKITKGSLRYELLRPDQRPSVAEPKDSH